MGTLDILGDMDGSGLLDGALDIVGRDVGDFVEGLAVVGRGVGEYDGSGVVPASTEKLLISSQVFVLKHESLQTR